MRILATLLFTLVATAATALQAQDLPVRVGRVAYIDGRASLYQDPDGGWERAYVNSPITSENSVWTDEGSRAEVRISGVAIRLDALTQLDVVRLDEAAIDSFIAAGSVSLRVRHQASDERLVFRTSNARVRIRADGRYRIDVDPQIMETRITVFAGEALVGTDDGRMRVAAGRSVVIFGSDPPEFYEEAARPDSFDRWSLARDERWREGRSTTYVSSYMTGYEDLDAYGQWVSEPNYGALWYPRGVAANWAPYRYGRWDYVRPWGWTWIDDSPWGYAPFHYGRWVYVRDRWAWHPGERIARPVWAPALVAWIGGSNFSVGVSTGGPAVGWYPLSPWDRYEPWFQASPTYVNRVNIVVRRDRPATDDRRRWQDWTRERGTTVVNRSALVDSRPIAAAAIPLGAEAIRRIQPVQQPQAILPTRNDVIQRRREQPQQAVVAPRQPAAVARQDQQAGRPTQQAPSAIVRPDFARGAVTVAPQRATREALEQQRQAQERAQRDAQQQTTRDTQQQLQQRQVQERAQREAQQQQEKAARDAQQQTQQQRQAQERAQREAQQQQEKAARDAQQQTQQQRQAQERAQREAQQQQEKAARDAQQQTQQQRQAQERAQREAQQQQEKAAREAQQQQEKAARDAQQQQQRQAQERAQREAQQQQEKAAREAQQQQQQAQQRAAQQAQEKAAREAQQQQEKAAREAQQQQQAQQRAAQQAQEKAAREAQQAQEKAARETQQRAQQQQQEKAAREAQQAQEKAAREAQQQQEKAAREAQQQQQRQAQERAQQQQAQQRAAQQAQEKAAREAQQVQEKAAREAQLAKEKAARDAAKKEKDDEDEKGKGKGRGP